MERRESLEVSETHQDNQIFLHVAFPNAVVGKGKKRLFRLEFDDTKYVIKTGEVWEVSLPSMRNSTTFKVASVTLQTPKEWGQLSHIFPEPVHAEETETVRSHVFRGGDIETTGVVAAFGQFQVFEFSLFYHLENPLNKEAPIEIALPPDTAYQKLMYHTIEPKPQSVTVDPDGNWIARFALSPRQRVDVKADGHVQIYNTARLLPLPSAKTLQANLAESPVWQTTDPAIMQKAQELRTPKAIYDYVVQTLSYDYTRVIMNAQRFGAVEALQRPTQALCTEFTDLFIALARAAGIPAREVNGYVHTDKSNQQPVSLVADVLHAWPEYWDEHSHTWIAIDPTWEKTTGGVDYFTKPDLKHFTFAIHGTSHEYPYPAGSYQLGAEPQKNVFVTFSKLPLQRESTLELSISPQAVSIKNAGPAALYNQNLAIAFDERVALETSFAVIPPFATVKAPYKIPYGVVTNMPSFVSATVGDQTVVYKTRKEEFTIVLLTVFVCMMVIFVSVIIWKRRNRV